MKTVHLGISTYLAPIFYPDGMKNKFLIVSLILITGLDCFGHIIRHQHPQHRKHHPVKHYTAVPDTLDSVYRSRVMALPMQCPPFYNTRVRKYINLYAIKSRRSMGKTMGRGKFYFPVIEEVFKSNGIPVEMKYITIIESSLNPRAISGGVAGMWQFTRGTGQKFGLTINGLVDERRGIIEPAAAVARYLNTLYNIYQDWYLVIAAYNCGNGRVNQAIRLARGNKDYWKVQAFLPEITRNFVAAFMAIAYTFQYYEVHGIIPEPCNLPATIDTVNIYRRLYLQQVASVLNIDLLTLKDINTQYLHDLIPAQESKSYALYLPADLKSVFLNLQDSVYAFKMPGKILSGPLQAIPDMGTQGKIIHKVKSGESLYVIAKKYRVSVTKIREWNGISGNKIKPGQKIIILKPIP